MILFRFLLIKLYITQLRLLNPPKVSEDQLNRAYPENTFVPPLLKIAWERHVLWTRNYREFCLNSLGAFIESTLYSDDTTNLESQRNAYAVLVRTYAHIFHESPGGICWTEITSSPNEFSSSHSLNAEVYPHFETVVTSNLQHPSMKQIADLASSLGFDDVLPIEQFYLNASFYAPFKTHVCIREPIIRQLSEKDYDSLIQEYIKFMIILKTVVIGRNSYNPYLTERSVVLNIFVSLLIFYSDVNYLYPDNVAPSNIIDLIWHSHMLCTREYRDYCANKFGTFLDHHPTIMNSKYSRNDSQGYENTIRIYKELFGKIPPYLWWPRAFDGHVGQPCDSYSRREGLLRNSTHEMTAANI